MKPRGISATMRGVIETYRIMMRLSFILVFPLGLALLAPQGEAQPVRSASSEIRSVTSERSRVDSRKGPIVYVMKTDTRFHSIGCPRLHNPEESFALEDAMMAGYGPCPRCSKEILEKTSGGVPVRHSHRRSHRSRAGLISSGPPYIVIVRPQHRVVSSFPPIGF